MRIVLFVVLIFVLGGLWIGGWFFAADRLETGFANARQALRDSGQQFDCENSEISGFPFRIGVFCGSSRYTSSISGLVVETGALRSAMQFYAPGKAVIEIESPGLVRPPAGNPLAIEWQSLRASVSGDRSGPERFSLEGREVVILEQLLDGGKTTLAGLQFHARRNGEQSLEIALALDRVKTTPEPGRGLPIYNASAQVRLDDIYGKLLAAKNFLKLVKANGVSGEITAFEIRPDTGGALLVQGPVRIDTRGRVSGKFQVSFADLDKLALALGRIAPQIAPALTQAAAVANLVSSQAENGMLSLPVTVNAGEMFIGPLKIGELPGLFD